MLTDKDKKMLINKANRMLTKLNHDRVMITEAPESIISHFEDNRNSVGVNVVVVRSSDEQHIAARARNSGEKTLFIFGEKFPVTSYFSGTCHHMTLSDALYQRARKTPNFDVAPNAKPRCIIQNQHGCFLDVSVPVDKKS